MAPVGDQDPCLRTLIVQSLSHLGPLTGNLSIFLAQPEVDSPALRRLGFASVMTASHFCGQLAPADAVLIVTLGTEGIGVQRAVEALNQHIEVPTVLVVMIVPAAGGRGPIDEPRDCIDFAIQARPIRKVLFDSGADDVMSLYGTEALTPHRVMESVQKSEYMANKMSEIIGIEVNAAEDKAARKVQQAHRKFLMMLPGRVLENIPYENEHLKERKGEGGALLQVGNCAFETKLGSGAFGHVFKAAHSKHGPCAVKIISKTSVKNANVLVSLDRELSYMLYSDPHPNIVRAREVMHGQHNFYIVMNYAGPLHLQRYTKVTLEQMELSALPPAIVKSFTSQEASAVSHLHCSMVCHRDIKPDNWIVSDDGTVVRLADFGLATQLAGPMHFLRQSCGSLPFCAPEVFNSEFGDAETEGYDGLSADVWSLGVNYMELVCGPYSIEKLLGWLPQHPSEHDTTWEGLKSLERHWVSIMDDSSGLMKLISKMLVLEPTHRWNITQVLGGHNIAVGRQMLLRRQLTSRRQSARSRRALEGAASAAPPGHVGHWPDGPDGPIGAESLCSKLGGPDLIRNAVERMVDSFLWTPGCGEAFGARPESAQKLRLAFAADPEALFDTVPGSSRHEDARAQVRKACEGLPLVQAHFTLLMDQLATALRHFHVEKAAISQGLDWLKGLLPEATADGSAMIKRAVERNTLAWRSLVLARPSTQDTFVHSYSERLKAGIDASPLLSRTALRDYGVSDIAAHLLEYLRGNMDTWTGPILLPQKALSSINHLVLLCLARDAFTNAGWPQEDRDTLYLVALKEWSGMHS